MAQPSRTEILQGLPDRWEKLKTTDSQLPLELPNGCGVEDLSVSCSDCGVDVTKQNTRGEIEEAALGFHVKLLNKCLLCGRFNFMSGDVLVTGEDGFVLAFPPPGKEMTDPWTDVVFPKTSA